MFRTLALRVTWCFTINTVLVCNFKLDVLSFLVYNVWDSVCSKKSGRARQIKLLYVTICPCHLISSVKQKGIFFSFVFFFQIKNLCARFLIVFVSVYKISIIKSGFNIKISEMRCVFSVFCFFVYCIFFF